MLNPIVNTTHIKSTTLKYPRNTSIQPHPSHNPLKLPQPLTFIVIMSFELLFLPDNSPFLQNKISSCLFFSLIYLFALCLSVPSCLPIYLLSSLDTWPVDLPTTWICWLGTHSWWGLTCASVLIFPEDRQLDPQAWSDSGSIPSKRTTSFVSSNFIISGCVSDCAFGNYGHLMPRTIHMLISNGIFTE